jgi:DNA-binding beta-propeller fold protein YncE
VDGQDNVYVTDVGNPVHKLSSTGAPLALVPVVYRGAPNFPTGVALDQQGNLYTAEGATSMIDKTSPTGQPLAQWGGGSGLGQFAKPSGIALDSAGDVCVTDTGNNRVEEFSPRASR